LAVRYIHIQLLHYNSTQKSSRELPYQYSSTAPPHGTVLAVLKFTPFAIETIPSATFETSKRAERNGRNPQTGAEITISAATTPVFKAGKVTKDAVK